MPSSNQSFHEYKRVGKGKNRIDGKVTRKGEVRQCGGHKGGKLCGVYRSREKGHTDISIAFTGVDKYG